MRRPLIATLLAASVAACSGDPEPAARPVLDEPEPESSAAEETPAEPAERPRVDAPPPPRPGAIPAPEDVSAVPDDATRTASGLAYRVLRPGDAGGESPGPRDRVEVHYTGWRAEDGQMFDSSRSRGRPIELSVNGVIPGWQEALQMMVPGEQRRLWIPASLAYEGRRGPQGMLVFDVELIGVTRTPDPPPTPENVSAPPASAERSASGLAWVVLERGQGERHPSPSDRVLVHYTGWRAEDGEMFDSSIPRGRPMPLPVSRVIAGWQEGLPLMVEGEKRRFWIPASLAYEGRPSGPQGMLVFDIELIEIL